MTKSFGSRTMAFVLGAGLLLLPSCTFAESEQARSWSFEVADGGRVEVRAEVGSIRVEAGEEGAAGVTVSGEVESGSWPIEVEVEQRGETLWVEATAKPGGEAFNTPFGIEIDVTVPPGFAADLQTSGGNVVVRELNGTVEAATRGGDLEFVRTAGKVTATTGGGNVRVRETVGPVRVRTGGGNIDVRDTEGAVDAETAGGNARVSDPRGSVRSHASGGNLEARLGEAVRGPLDLSTEGGNLTVRLAPGVAVAVDALANGGSASAADELGSALRGDETGRWLGGEIGRGGPELKLRSSGGNIRLLALPALASSAPAVQDLEGQDVQPVVERFNAWKDRVRLVLLLSPGCETCLQQARDVQERIVERYSSAGLGVLTVWLQLLEGDDYEAAQAAARTMTDSRVLHFWDPARILALSYGSSLPLPEDYGWKFAVKVFLLFDQGVVWEGGEPMPQVWFHDLGDDENRLDLDELADEVAARLSAEGREHRAR